MVFIIELVGLGLLLICFLIILAYKYDEWLYKKTKKNEKLDLQIALLKSYSKKKITR
jgi:hypothetical protein